MVSVTSDSKSVLTAFDPCTMRIQNRHWAQVRPMFLENS